MRLLRFLLSVALLSVALSIPALAWNTTKLPPGFVIETPGSPVEFNGKPLFKIRVKQKTQSAEQRARLISERIKKLAQDPTFNPRTIKVEDSSLSSVIMAGDQVIMSIWAFEAKVEGRTAYELSREDAGKIRHAIETYHQEHSFHDLVFAALKTLAALVVFVLLFLGLLWLARRIIRAIRATQKIRAINIGNFEFFNTDRIKAVLEGTVKIFRLLVALLLFYGWMQLSLGFFPWTHKYAVEIYKGLFDVLAAIGRAVGDQIPSIIFLIVLLLIARYVLKMLRFFFEQVEAGQITLTGVDAEVAPITYKIFRLIIIAFVAVIAYPLIPGSQSAAFKGISIFLGVLLSLGSTSAVANLIAGVSLTYTRSFREGDVIKVGDSLGVVLERKLYTTRIKTFKNRIITIPNSLVLSNHVANLSYEARDGDGLILHTRVSIGFGTPWETVHALLIEAASATKHILMRPPPFVLQIELNDFYVVYEINAYTDAPELMTRIYGELHQNIQNKFNEAGVEIMSPHYTQIRDGNQTTIPTDYLPPDYVPPAIRIVNNTGPGDKK